MLTKMTRKQREALLVRWKLMNTQGRPCYREFRRSVLPTFRMDDAVAVKWCGMWLCIEADGYTHS